jgi:hypothetical protein
VVKANYVRLGSGGRAARASATYYGHRPDRDGGRGYRPAFDSDRDGLEKDEVYGRAASAAGGGYAYRIVLSPGHEMDAEEIRGWTREVMYAAEREGAEWFGFVHDDHTDHAHAHVVAFTGSKLGREDLAEMREEGDRVAERVLESRAEIERDPMQGEQIGHEVRLEVRQEPRPGPREGRESGLQA